MQGDTDLIALHHVLASSKGSSPLLTFLPLILIVVAFYFFLIRPQRNRQRAQSQLQNQVAPGQRVMTTAGMLATVVEIDDDGVLLEIAPGVEARFVRQAIGQVLPDEVEDLEDEYEDDDEVDEDAEIEDEVEAAHDAEEGEHGEVADEPEALQPEKKPSA